MFHRYFISILIIAGLLTSVAGAYTVTRNAEKYEITLEVDYKTTYSDTWPCRQVVYSNPDEDRTIWAYPVYIIPRHETHWILFNDIDTDPVGYLNNSGGGFFHRFHVVWLDGSGDSMRGVVDNFSACTPSGKELIEGGTNWGLPVDTKTFTAELAIGMGTGSYSDLVTSVCELGPVNGNCGRSENDLNFPVGFTYTWYKVDLGTHGIFYIIYPTSGVTQAPIPFVVDSGWSPIGPIYTPAYQELWYSPSINGVGEGDYWSVYSHGNNWTRWQ